MINFFTILAGFLGLLVSLMLAAHAKVKTASVIVHHTGHGQGPLPVWLGRPAVELLGILALVQPVEVYRSEHRLHHRYRSFARPEFDPDAALIVHWGFFVGMTVEEGWRTVRRTLMSPRVHAELIVGRLRHNFTVSAAGTRRALVAWLLWGMIGLAALATQTLGAIAIYLLLSMIAGNIASMLELLSRHLWLIEGFDDAERQRALSNLRLPESSEATPWLKRLFGALDRHVVYPLDLAWHGLHHLAKDVRPYRDQPAWSNPDDAHAPHIESSGLIRHRSSLAAIRYWLERLQAGR